MVGGKMSNYYAFNTRKERCPIDFISFNYSGGTLPGGSYVGGNCTVPAGGSAILRFTKSGNASIISVLGMMAVAVDIQWAFAITAFHPHNSSGDYIEVEVVNLTNKERTVRSGQVLASALCNS